MVDDVLRALHALGFRLTVEDDKLTVKPRALLTPELRTVIKQHRDGLITVLKAGGPGPSPYVDPGLGDTVTRLAIAADAAAGRERSVMVAVVISTLLRAAAGDRDAASLLPYHTLVLALHDRRALDQEAA